MSDNIERYVNTLMAAIEIHQLRIEIKNRLNIIGDNLTASELHTRDFENDASKSAILLIGHNPEISIESKQYVKSSLEYKDVDISLHTLIDELGSKAMVEVLTGINSNQVLKY